MADERDWPDRVLSGAAVEAAPTPRSAGGLTLRRWLAPAAVAVAVVAWLAQPGSPLRPAGIDHFVALPDGARGASPAPHEGWRSGDAFTLRADVRSPSLLLLVHVDPAGRVEVLAPQPQEPVRARPAGAMVFPPATERWTLEGAAGVETFLLAARHDVADTASVSRAAVDVERLGGGSGAVARTRAFLEERFDVVREARIEHGP